MVTQGLEDHQLEMMRQMESEEFCQLEAILYQINSQLEAVVYGVFADGPSLCSPVSPMFFCGRRPESSKHGSQH